MEALISIVVVGGFISFFIGMAIWSHRAEKKRTAAWEQFAQTLGFQFIGKDPELLARMSNMKIFSRGHSRRARNTIAGEAGGIEVRLTDYRYTTGSGKNQSTHHQTLCVLRADHLNLPHCYLRQEVAIFDFLGKLFGGQDINFEDDPEFSKTFVLQGEDEDFVREVFDSETRTFFVDLKKQDAKSTLVFEAGDDTLVVHHGRRIDPAQAEDLMQQAFSILQIFSRTE